MEEIKKYELREKKIPYYYEKELKEKFGEQYKMFEIFDGKETRWGVKEDNVNIPGEKFERTTPLFQNELDKNGKDKDRFIYTERNKLFVCGKINNQYVLYKFTDNPSLDSNFVEVCDFGLKDYTIKPFYDGTALIRTHDGVLPKCFFYDMVKGIRCSNIMDVLYDNNCFLKSFQYGDKVRVFMGRLTYSPVMVRQFGCDVNKDDVIIMPTDEYGLLDESKMIEDIKSEKKDIGINIDQYKNAITDDFYDTLFNLNVYEFGIMTRMNKYEDYVSRGKRR